MMIVWGGWDPHKSSFSSIINMNYQYENELSILLAMSLKTLNWTEVWGNEPQPFMIHIINIIINLHFRLCSASVDSTHLECQYPRVSWVTVNMGSEQQRPIWHPSAAGPRWDVSVSSGGFPRCGWRTATHTLPSRQPECTCSAVWQSAPWSTSSTWSTTSQYHRRFCWLAAIGKLRLWAAANRWQR